MRQVGMDTNHWNELRGIIDDELPELKADRDRDPVINVIADRVTEYVAEWATIFAESVLLYEQQMDTALYEIKNAISELDRAEGLVAQ